MRSKAFVLFLSLTFVLTGIVSYADEEDLPTNNGQYLSEDSNGDKASQNNGDSLGGGEDSENDGNAATAAASVSDSSQGASEDGSSSGTESSGTGSGGSTGAANTGGSGTTSGSTSSSRRSSTAGNTEADSASVSDDGADEAGEAADASLYEVSQEAGIDAEDQDDTLGDEDGFQLIYDINIAGSTIFTDSEETDEGEETETLAEDHTRYTVDQTFGVGSLEQVLSVEEAFPTLEDTADNGMGYQDQYRKFVYWNTEPDGSGATLDPREEEEVLFTDHDIILYAVWTKMDLTMSVDTDGDGVYDDDGMQVSAGDSVVYRISYNNGYDSAVGLSVTEVLEEGLTFVSAESGNYDEETRTLTWSLDYVESGMDGTLSFTASVNENAYKNSEIGSEASVRVNSYPAVETNRVENWVPMELTVSAIWNDNEDEEGIRPENLQVQLLADGENSGDPVEVNEENSWSYTWEDLPLYADGEKITYTIEGEPVEGYDQTCGALTDKGSGTFEVSLTNEFVSATVRIGGSVTWLDVSDEKDYSSKRPEEMTVHLLADGQKVENITLTEDDGWEWEVSGLDKYSDDGIPITYTVTADVVKDYVTEIDGYGITNSYSPYRINLNVQLIWDDADGKDGIRPTSVIVELLENGEKTGETLTLDASDGFSGCFTGLDAYTNGENIDYTVEVSQINGYKTFVTEERDTNCIILRSVPLTDAEAETEADLTDDAADTGDDIHWWSFLFG